MTKLTQLRRLSTRAAGFDRKLAALTRYDAAQVPAVQKAVQRILADVREAMGVGAPG